MATEDAFKTNLNNVKEFILDEEKLVTYVTLSIDLGIHVNYSKKLLHNAVEIIRKEHPKIPLNVNYILSGLSDKAVAITTVCTENNLNKLKEGYKIIFFYHIYSVSKGFPCVDPNAYLLLNKFEDYNLCTGIIKNDECNKRISDEIGNLKSNTQEIIPFESKTNIVSNKKVNQEASIASDAPKNEQQTEQNKAIEINIKNEVTSPPKKEININKSTAMKANGHKCQKGIALFFNKANDTQNKKNIKHIKDKSISENILEVKQEKMDKDDEIAEPEETDKTKYKHDEYKVLNTEAKSIKNIDTLKTIKKSALVDKKRKRVLQISDSDSEEENDPFVDKKEGNQESDDEIPPTPSADNNIKITLGMVNPKKRRKIVDKTYTSEDGYTLTKKEEVYESCSEQEEENMVEKVTKSEAKVKHDISPKDKRTSPKKSKKKISPPQKGKQQTLNSFFKRK